MSVAVIDASGTSSGRTAQTYQPTIAFIDASGIKQSGPTFMSSSAYNYERGVQVGILYDARAPSYLRINSWFALWGFGFVFLAIGLLTFGGLPALGT